MEQNLTLQWCPTLRERPGWGHAQLAAVRTFSSQTGTPICGFSNDHGDHFPFLVSYYYLNPFLGIRENLEQERH